MVDMNWDARSETIPCLKEIYRNHPKRIELYEEKYAAIKASRIFDQLKKYEYMRNYKRMIDMYKKQLYFTKIELILRGKLNA